MSMTKDAVQHIQDSANIPTILKQLEVANTEIPLIAVPNSMETESLERYMKNASRYRLDFSTENTSDFIKYNKKFDADGATCFVNAEEMSARTIFDLGTIESPLHKEHKASIKLKMLAAFSALVEFGERPKSQKHAAEFIEDWADNIQVFNKAGDSMTTAVAAKELCDLTISAAREVNSQVDDFGEGMSAMERIEAKNQDKIPAAIEFKCIPYNGLQERTFKVRIGILTTGDRPTIAPRILQLEATKEAMAEEFKEILTNGFEELKLETFIGSAGR